MVLGSSSVNKIESVSFENDKKSIIIYNHMHVQINVATWVGLLYSP